MALLLTAFVVLFLRVPLSGDTIAEATPPPPPSELVQQRTETSRTFDNHDGTYTRALYSGPIHFRDAERRWQPISSEVVPAGEAGYAWRNEANSFVTLFKPEAQGEYLGFRLGGRLFSLSLEGAANSSVQRRRFGLSYPEVFPGVDLRYDLSADSVKETLVLANAQAPSHYRFLLRPPDNTQLRTERLEDGSWAFFRRTRAAPLFVFAAPSMTERGGVASDQSHVSMDVGDNGDHFAIDLNVDAAWLSDPVRQFPVRLDPTIAIQPAVQDTTFDSGCPTCNAIANDRLSIGTEPISGPSFKKWRSAVKFDLGDIPAGANITTAQLKLYFDGTCLTGSCGTANHDLNLHRLTSTWITTSKGSSFTYDAAVLSTFTLAGGASAQWMSWNLTSLVGNWISGAQPNYGVLVKRSAELLGSKGPKAPSSRYAEPSLGPKLEITYTGDGVDLLPVTSLHANGAELNWTRFDPPSNASFEKYEIHRSASAHFSPSSSTLLATLRDVVMTSYIDTTAGPSGTFSYRIVANASISNERRVTLPADGQASKVVQAEPGLTRATYIAANYDPCQSAGGESRVYVGAITANSQKYRSLLAFDLRTIPANSTVSSATLSLWHPDTLAAAITVEARALTADWEEGYVSGLPGCGAGGGASWLETNPGIAWTAPGGDFEAGAASATQVDPVGEQASWDNFALTGLVQRWANIETPNHGVLLKAANEGLGATWFSYYSNDWTVSPTLRPKLAVSYADGSHALAPSVAISEPGSNATASGAAVTISAAARDDRRVDQVAFLVDGQLVATDTSDPFSISWDSRTVANGSHTLSARATDDAGNITTSAGVTIQVVNSNPPTTSITSPANGATLTGTVNVTAAASDDFGVTKVEFYIDKVLFATDTTAPYAFSWNTLDPDRPAYDGSHAITSKAYDAHQSTLSAARSVTTANTVGTRYRAIFQLLTRAPQSLLYDPAAPNQQQYGISVQVQNNSSFNWTGGDMKLRYRWFSPDSPAVVTNGPSTTTVDLAAGAQATRLLLLEPPVLPEGVNRALYRLRVDLYEQSTGTWFAARGNRPYERQVTIDKALPVGLGLEGYYRYDEESLGAGMSNLVNVANGNSILRWAPFSAPGRGLSTRVGLTYNSLESASESPVGNNFSLSVSSLTRFGLPLDVHPTEADTLAGHGERWIGFVDADGTAHRFEGRTAQDGSIYWEEPPGQHLYLREFSTTDVTRKWAITARDRTTYFYDSDGYPTSVEDGNGNRLAFTLEQVTGGPATGVTKRVTLVTDAAGLDSPPKPNRSFAITYYTDNDTRAAPVVGRVKRITDHNGSALDFFYYDDGNLRIITQRGGGSGPIGVLGDRSFVFEYTTPDGLGPAIPGPGPPPPDPDPGVVESTRLYSVMDPRGHATVFTYVPPLTSNNGWKLGSRQNRGGVTTSFSYDTVAGETTVTAPLGRVNMYRYDSEGKVNRITRPDNAFVTMTWTSDRMLQKTFEPSGAYMERAYNDNGQVTDEWDQLRNHTLHEYENLAVDANDASGKWRAGRTIPHLSQRSATIEPRGTATPDPDDYRTQFGHNAQGNLTSETDPLENVIHHTYRADGTLETTTDASSHTTTYADIDANGFSTRVIDPLGRVSTSSYDDDGLLIWQQDPLHAAYSGGSPRQYRTYSDYDSFDRLRRQSMPKSTTAEPGAIIWTSTDYDSNNNVTVRSAPFEGNDAMGARTTTSYDDMDRQVLITGPDRSADPIGERTQYQYDEAGRVTTVTSPKGMLSSSIYDFATFSGYDVLDRVVTETRFEVMDGQITTTLRKYSCYNEAGDLVSVTEPEANIALADFNCSTPNLPYTTRYTFDVAHQERSEIDPLGHSDSTTYDANGNADSLTNADDKTTMKEYNQGDQLTKRVEPFSVVNGDPRNLTTKLEYDPSGNVKREISPRAWDASPDKQTFTEYVKTYQYDDAGQVVRVDLPTSTEYPQAHYVHNGYDANGDLTSASLPATTADPASVPADKKTIAQYFDNGAIRTIKDPENPRVHFAYSAQGRQASRVPESTNGELDTTRLMLWSRDVDGLVREIRDQSGNASTYTYDANDKIIGSIEARGLTDSGTPALEIENTLDGFDRLTKVRSRQAGETNYTATKYTYDRNDNASAQETNSIETPSGGTVTPGRVQEFTRDQAGWVSTQTDFGTDPSAGDDQHITNQWSPIGQETQRTRQIWSGGQWQTKQTTTWDHYANGELKNLTATNGGSTTYESHDVAYEDQNGIYINGNRTSDTFTRSSPNTQTPCEPVDPPPLCTASYKYDARDRLVTEDDGHGTTLTYALDPVGNLTTETVTQNGQPVTRAFSYAGSQLQSITSGLDTQRFFYDASGNFDCATTGSGSQGDCSPPADGPVSTSLLTDYAYDYKNRVVSSESFNNSMAAGSSRFGYDPLDRAVEEHIAPASGPSMTRAIVFAGVSSQVAQEEERSATGTLLSTKTYSYDAFGHRTSMTNVPNPGSPTLYIFGNDVHDSVSMLIGPTDVAASYGYHAYGGIDSTLSSGDTGTSRLNPYRYTGKRLDTVSDTYDMGARRFAAGTTRFAQRDTLLKASNDLSLATRAESQSRYALAGGNPLGFIEADGHYVIEDGEGEGGGPPNPPPPGPPPPGEPPPPAGQEAEEEWNYVDEGEGQEGEEYETREFGAGPRRPPGSVGRRLITSVCLGEVSIVVYAQAAGPFGYANAFGIAYCAQLRRTRVRLIVRLQTLSLGPLFHGFGWVTVKNARDSGPPFPVLAIAPNQICVEGTYWRAEGVLRVATRPPERDKAHTRRAPC